MIILRYSFNKFKPQYQSYNLKDVKYHLNKFNINKYPEWMRYEINKEHIKKAEFFRQNLSDLKYGIWAFIDGYKNNQALNHLKRLTPHWRAEISNNTIVIDSNWTKTMKITDNECKNFGIYIPQSQLRTLKIIL